MAVALLSFAMVQSRSNAAVAAACRPRGNTAKRRLVQRLHYPRGRRVRDCANTTQSDSEWQCHGAWKW